MLKKSLFDLPLDDLKSTLTDAGLPAYSATQVFDWVYKKKKFNPNEWSNISKKTKAFLEEHFSFDLPQIFHTSRSTDGTHKFLLKLRDGNTIESVLIKAPSRLTLCVSSQVGCAIGCRFCHTATQGLTRHLTTSEIVGQYMELSNWLESDQNPLSDKKITNIVFMGQGEPLHNFDNVKKSIEIFMQPKGLGLGQRKITLSTSGLVPQIEKLESFPPVNIAISLHSARNEVRTQLMPINKTYDLERLFKAIKTIPLKGHRRITYEYILIDNVNDHQEDIDALVRIVSRKESKINIIPFNEYPGSEYKRPSEEKIHRFSEKLIQKGYVSTIRASKGRDVLAACGQLKSSSENRFILEHKSK